MTTQEKLEAFKKEFLELTEKYNVTVQQTMHHGDLIAMSKDWKDKERVYLDE